MAPRPFQAVWDAREILLLLARRDVFLRYQHSIAGIGWAILQPLLTILVLGIFQSVMGRQDDTGIPYPLYAACALVPWTFLAHGINQAAHCIPKNAGILNKVYFPRLILPIAAVLAAAADFGLGLVIPPVLMIYYGVSVQLTAFAALFFAFEVILLAMAFGIWFACLNARFRDVANALPFLMQLWFFLSPIAYTAEMIPARWRILAGLNPMLGILEGFRWAVFGSANPMLSIWVTTSLAVLLILLASGLYVFLRTEDTLADII